MDLVSADSPPRSTVVICLIGYLHSSLMLLEAYGARCAIEYGRVRCSCHISPKLTTLTRRTAVQQAIRPYNMKRYFMESFASFVTSEDTVFRDSSLRRTIHLTFRDSYSKIPKALIVEYRLTSMSREVKPKKNCPPFVHCYNSRSRNSLIRTESAAAPL